MELQDYLLVVRKRWRVIVVVVLVTVGLAAVATLMADKVYESRTQFFVSTTGSSDSGALLQGSTFTQQRVKSYAQLLTTPRILAPVAEAVGVDGDIAAQVTATTPPDTVLIEVAVRDEDPAQAKAMAEAIAKEFPAAVSELESTAGTEASPVKVTVVRPPTTPVAPVSPKPFRNILLGGVLGLLLGLGAALVRETLDKTIKTQDDIKAVTDRPLLGGIAHDADAAKRPLIVEVDPRSPRAEAFRALRTNLQFVDAANHPRTIVVTSSLAGEGKSTMTANLALTMAQAGSRVCLIEADLRRPKVLEYMGLEGGSASPTRSSAGPTCSTSCSPTAAPASGCSARVRSHPTRPSCSGPPRCGACSPPSPRASTTSSSTPRRPCRSRMPSCISKLVDGAIVVVGSGIVQRDQLARTLENLESVSGSVLGSCSTGSPPSSGSSTAATRTRPRRRRPRAGSASGWSRAETRRRRTRGLSRRPGTRRGFSARTTGARASSTSAAICANRAGWATDGVRDVDPGLTGRNQPAAVGRRAATTPTQEPSPSRSTTSLGSRPATRSAKSRRVKARRRAAGCSRAAAPRCSRAAVRTRSAAATRSVVSCRAVKPSASTPAPSRRARESRSMSRPTSAWVPALVTTMPVPSRSRRSRRSMYGDRQTLPVHTTRTVPGLLTCGTPVSSVSTRRSAGD